MKIDLSGKTAIVTGSTEGIGYAAAEGLARAGAKVVINGRNQSKVDATISRLKKAVPGAEAIGVAVDLSNAEGCARLKAAVAEADILVNNLGVFALQPFLEIPDEEWERFFQTNIMSGVRLARAYLDGMTKRNWGRIIFISSESALNIPADMIHYGMTKTAQLGLSRGLAKLTAGTGVTVNAVLPGPTLTEGAAEMLKGEMARSGESVEEAGATFVKRERSSSIIGRMATPEEVANMIVYACSPQASATTGAALRVDGGVVDSIV
jgi:NAD(P)-dependent dehydrogenase (short-subunit alcohol dehydrogenase family)